MEQGGEVSARTVTGSIDLGNKVAIKKKETLSSLFDNAEMMGATGGVFLDNEMGRRESVGYTDNEIEGTLGIGDAKIELETINGNIYIK